MQEELPAAAYLQVPPKVEGTQIRHEWKGRQSLRVITKGKKGRGRRTQKHGAGKADIACEERAETYLSFRQLGLPTRIRGFQGVGREGHMSHVAPTLTVSPGLAAHNQGLRREILGVVRARRGAAKEEDGGVVHCERDDGIVLKEA